MPEAEVQRTGLQHDRRWMLIDETGLFVSQRTHTQLATLQVNLTEEGFMISHKKDSIKPFFLSFNETTNTKIQVNIWDDQCIATEVSPSANKWFSDVLQMRVRLVYMPETTQRLVEPDYANNNEIVSFADAYPFMMIGQSSLDDLNNRLDKPVLMNRFRPNFVFSGGTPYIEDKMESFKIGDINFKGVRPCARCVLTTINQENATKGSEPLKTLATYRTVKNKVMFGQNLLHSGEGIVRVGDKIEVIKLHD